MRKPGANKNKLIDIKNSNIDNEWIDYSGGK